MSIALRGTYTGTTPTSTSLALSLASGSAAVSGDVEILAIVADTAPGTLSGWTTIASAAAPPTGQAALYWRAYSSQNHTISVPGDASVAIAVYSGVDSSSPIASSGVSTNSLPNLTISRDGSLELTADTHTDARAATSAPSGWATVVSGLYVTNNELDMYSRTFTTQTATGSLTGNDHSGTTGTYFTCVLNPTPAVPYTPSLIGPAPGAAEDINNGAIAERTFSWSYSDPQRGTQTGFQLRRKIGAGSYEYWTGTTWGGTPTTVSSSATTVTLPTGKWTTSGAAVWSVATVNGTGTSAFAADQAITANQRPTVTVTAPTGTVTTTTRPTTTWTYTDAESNPQTTYQVRAFTSAQVGAGGFDPAVTTPMLDSGEQTGTATSWASTSTDLANGTYVPYVRVGQADPGGGSSTYYGAWTAGSSWVQNVALPAAPTSVTPTPRPSTGDVSVVVVANVTGLTTPTVRLERSSDGGTTWTTVRGGLAASIASGTATIIDREAPPSPASVQYRARVSAIAGGTITGTNTTSASTLLALTGWWLRDPTAGGVGDLTFAVGSDSLDLTATEAAGLFRPLGRRTDVKVAEAGATGGEHGTLTISLRTDTDYTTLEALRKAQKTLLLLSPYGECLYVVFTADRTASFPLGTNRRRLRTVTLPITEVDAPAVTS